MPRHLSFLVAFALALPGVGHAQEPIRGDEDGAPLLLLYGPFAATRALASALSDIARRDGGSFLDLSVAELPPPSASGELRHAVAAYQEFDYGRAMKHLSAAMEEILRDGVRGLSNSDLCDLFIYRALVRNAQGDSSAAWNDFVQAALIDPTRHLDAVRFSPSVAASFERARKEVSESAPRELRVVVGKSCKVSVDGIARGNNAAISLRAGAHFVRIECSGYEIFSELLRIDANLVLEPNLLKISPPSRNEVLAIAKERGFHHLVFVRVALALPHSAALFELLRSDNTEISRTSMTLSGTNRDKSLAMSTTTRLLDALSPVPLAPIKVAASSSWVQSPWLWGAVGAAIASAVLLPFALRDQPSAGFRLELGGATP